MNLPNIPVQADDIINEYHNRYANLMAGNIRLTAMLHVVIQQRDDALKRWQEEVDKHKTSTGDEKVAP